MFQTAFLLIYSKPKSASHTSVRLFGIAALACSVAGVAVVGPSSRRCLVALLLCCWPGTAALRHCWVHDWRPLYRLSPQSEWSCIGASSGQELTRCCSAWDQLCAPYTLSPLGDHFCIAYAAAEVPRGKDSHTPGSCLQLHDWSWARNPGLDFLLRPSNMSLVEVDAWL